MIFTAADLTASEDETTRNRYTPYLAFPRTFITSPIHFLVL